ncbi:MAG: xanthine dehydrogenase molybdopterin binding subunit [Polyangiaceae bacterium]
MTSLRDAIPHESAHGHVTGQALYTDDLTARHPDALHCWPVCVEQAHARVRGLDASRALAQPGVVTVLTAADVSGDNQLGPAVPDEPLFPDEVMYHGHAVAWVVAESEAVARAAAALVTVETQPLPAVLEIEEAIAQQHFLTDALRIRRGDPEGAIASAPHRIQGELAIGGQEHVYLETHAALALLDETGHVFVHASTQHPTETQEIVARILGLPKNEVTVQLLRMGGAFGGKEVQANTWAAVAALAARKTGRAVRVRLDRQRDMALTGKRHPFLGRYEVGFDDQGKILGAKFELYADGGWCLDLTEPIVYRAMFHIDNAYHLVNVDVLGRGVRTNHTSHTAFRGFGGPQGMIVIEEVMDRIARELGRAPESVRRHNFYRSGDSTHYQEPVKDADRIERIWASLLADSEFEQRKAAIAQFNANHATTKRGLAITPVKFGISFTATFYNQAGALVLVYKDGSVQVNHGGTEMGQGLHTKMMQVAAHTLGISTEHVRLMPTRTDKVPNTSATAASSGSDLNGAAVKRACEEIRDNLATIAASELGCDAAKVRFEHGNVFAEAEPASSLSFADVCKRAYYARVPLFASGYYRTPDIHFDKAAGSGRPFHYYAYGAAVSEVEVDGFTGGYVFRRVDILHDVGNSLSPLVDRGQVEGGFIQGLGWLTLEELVWDDAGRLATRGLSTYKLPGLGECPEVFNVRLLDKADEPTVVYGSKAVGEPPFMLALSVREALRDAVAAFGRGGRVQLPSPATPEAVFFAIERQRNAAGATEQAAQ